MTNVHEAIQLQQLRRSLLYVGLSHYIPEPAGQARVPVAGEAETATAVLTPASAWSNNQLNLSSYQLGGRSGDLFYDAARQLGRLTTPYHPDLVIGVPPMASDAGEAVASISRTDSLRLGWNSLVQQPVYRGDTKLLMGGFRRIIVVQDVLDDETLIQPVLRMKGIEGNVAAVISIWDRRDPALESSLQLPTEAVITEHIPDILPACDPLWSSACEDRRL